MRAKIRPFIAGDEGPRRPPPLQKLDFIGVASLKPS
jgi:hypothetical protein